MSVISYNPALFSNFSMSHYKGSIVIGCAIGCALDIILFSSIVRNMCSRVLSSLRATVIPNRWDKVLRKSLSCAEIKILYEEIVAKQIISVRFVSNKNYSVFVSLDKREIYLKDGLSDDMALADFVAGLIIISNSHEFYAIKKQADEIIILDAHKYAEEFEKILFKGMMQHHQIMQKAVQDMGWDTSLDVYKMNVTYSFQKYWNQIKEFPEVEAYKRDFNNLFRTPEKQLSINNLTNLES